MIKGKPKQSGTVLVLCPGGLDDGGGIGRQMGYFLQAYSFQNRDIAYRVIDSRGPWFLGASPRHTIHAAFFLVGAALTMGLARFTSAPCLAHVNITGRGSTFRKLVLGGVARAVGLPYILHVHDPDYAKDYKSRHKLVQSMVVGMFQGAAAVLVLGHHDKGLLTPLLRLAPDRVRVLHNAVPDPEPELPKQRHRRHCQILFLGHLSARKGVPELLQAMASPTLASLPWRLTLAGGGPIEEFYSLAIELGLNDRVNFPGWLDAPRVHEHCENADILVLPSYAEGLAMAVLEGLAHGLAVVTTPVGAHSEVIAHNVSGLLVPPGDVEALAIALRRLIEDDNLRTKLQFGARARFLESFDVTTYSQRLNEIHMTLLEDVTAGVQPGRPGDSTTVTVTAKPTAPRGR